MIRIESTDDGRRQYFAVEPATGVFAVLNQLIRIERCERHPDCLAGSSPSSCYRRTIRSAAGAARAAAPVT